MKTLKVIVFMFVVVSVGNAQNSTNYGELFAFRDSIGSFALTVDELVNRVGIDFSRESMSASSLPHTSSGDQVLKYVFPDVGEFYFFETNDGQQQFLLSWTIREGFPLSESYRNIFDYGPQEVRRRFGQENSSMSTTLSYGLEQDELYFDFTNGVVSSITWVFEY